MAKGLPHWFNVGKDGAGSALGKGGPPSTGDMNPDASLARGQRHRDLGTPSTPPCMQTWPWDRASPFPTASTRAGAAGTGTHSLCFNTYRIKFVSVQSVLGQGHQWGMDIPEVSGSSPAASLGAAPGEPKPWGWVHGSWLVASKGHIHPGAGLRNSGVLVWGCEGTGAGRAGQAQPWGCSEPGGTHTVQPQQAQALPRGCLQGAQQHREDENESQSYPRAPESSRVHVSPAQG